MTNKPMLSVERELLERVSATKNMIDFLEAMDELRALLDKPVCAKCNDTGEADSGGVHPWGEGINIQCDCTSYDKNDCGRVELKHMTVSEGGVLRWMTGRKMQDCELYAMPDGSAIRSKLYAEQPAPVSADIVHDRAYRDGLKRGFSLGENGRIDQYQKEFDSYQREILQESKGNAAQVAVVMPERCFHCNQPGGQCCTTAGVAK